MLIGGYIGSTNGDRIKHGPGTYTKLERYETDPHVGLYVRKAHKTLRLVLHTLVQQSYLWWYNMAVSALRDTQPEHPQYEDDRTS